MSLEAFPCPLILHLYASTAAPGVESTPTKVVGFYSSVTWSKQTQHVIWAPRKEWERESMLLAAAYLTDTYCLAHSASTLWVQEAAGPGKGCQSARHSENYSFAEQQWSSLNQRDSHFLVANSLFFPSPDMPFSCQKWVKVSPGSSKLHCQSRDPQFPEHLALHNMAWLSALFLGLHSI